MGPLHLLSSLQIPAKSAAQLQSDAPAGDAKNRKGSRNFEQFTVASKNMKYEIVVVIWKPSIYQVAVSAQPPAQGPSRVQTRQLAYRRPKQFFTSTKFVIRRYPGNGDAGGNYILVDPVEGGQSRVWRLPIVDTTAMPAGQFLVGALATAAHTRMPRSR